jgi:Nucleotidyl transferase AbiEii toxin, Type IV TA system
MPNNTLPDWDRVLSAAAHLQRILPDAVLVGGSATAIYAQHRMSVDADHVLTDLRERFDRVLAELESVAGWKTARVQRPVQILGKLDGIETGIRQLIREVPLEIQLQHVEVEGTKLEIALPSPQEMLRIKAVLILKRNATRDYLDFAALADRIGMPATLAALATFDALYPQANGESPLVQLQIQLSSPQPYDLDEVELAEYKQLEARWHRWEIVAEQCGRLAVKLLETLA